MTNNNDATRPNLGLATINDFTEEELEMGRLLKTERRLYGRGFHASDRAAGVGTPSNSITIDGREKNRVSASGVSRKLVHEADKAGGFWLQRVGDNNGMGRG